MIQHFARNTTGRDLVVGDIHGYFTKLQQALDAAGFDPARGDRLFSVGDLVDRGPESAGVLDWLAQPWFHSVQGNHETMLIDFDRGEMSAGHYAQNGGAWFIGMDLCTRPQYVRAVEQLPLAIEVETAAGLVGIVHADCPLASWADFAEALRTGAVTEHQVTYAQWSRRRIDGRHKEGIKGAAAVIVGHTPIEQCGCLGNVIYIDTGAWIPGGGDFALIDAGTFDLATRCSGEVAA